MAGESADHLFATMWLARAFEERVLDLAATGDINGLVHLGIGQEGVATGLAAALRPNDPLYVGHRAHGHFVARGTDLGRLMAELMGRRDGLCGGKGGSMHLVDLTHALMGATGVVGGNVPLACGTALALRESGGDHICAVDFGDGAVQAGHVHESLNIAALWSLPVLFVCENNGYAEFTARSEHTRVQHVIDLAAPYGMVARTIDGNDTLAVVAAARELAEHVRSGRGPALLECMTFRLAGHYIGDPAKYREARLLEEWRERDPLARLARSAAIPEEAQRETERRAREAVDAAVRFASASAWPSVADLASDVYA